MPPYKVLHLIGGGEVGGAEQHVLTLLTNLDKSLFTPLLACLVAGSFAELARQSGIETASFPMSGSFDLTPLTKLIQWARSHRVALLHCHGSRANLLGRLAAKYLRVPCLSTVHSSLRHDYLSPGAALAAVWLDRLTLPLSSGQIAISDYLAAEVNGRGGNNIRVIHNGHPALEFSPHSEREYFRKLWKIPADALVIGNIARFHPAKGQKILVQAAALLHKDIPNLHFILIGDGPLFTEIKKELEITGVPHTLPGYLPAAYKALPAMDLFVLPSLSEGMGLVLLEAMQAYIPIVASRTGGIPEVIRDRVDGLLVPPGDPEALAKACRFLLSNPLEAKAFTQSASRQRQNFSLEKMIQLTQAFYLEIIP